MRRICRRSDLMKAHRIKAVSLFLLVISICVTSCHSKPQEHRLRINLKAITHTNQVQEFTEIRQVALLPKAVRDQLGNMADPDGSMNVSDIYDPNLPSAKLQ